VNWKTALRRDGVAILSGTTLRDMLHIAESLGDVIPSRRGGPTLDLLQLVDSRSARPSSLSARYGTGAFPFHTDCAYYTVPPRFVLLRMGEGCSTDRPTYLLDSQSLSLSPSQQEAARRVLFGVKGAGREIVKSCGTELDHAASFSSS
jgi:hypothetical protein